MIYSLIYALALFGLVSSITPGPNNLMLMASGANFGFRRTIAHMFGVWLGFTFMIFMVGLGLGELFDVVPLLRIVLKVLSVFYMLYLAWRIAHAGPPSDEAGGGAASKPFGFIQAAGFQWVNPKAWTMALIAVTMYSPSHDVWGAVFVALGFSLVNLPSISLWVLLGVQMRKLLTNVKRLRIFNWTMAVLLVASLYPLLFGFSGLQK